MRSPKVKSKVTYHQSTGEVQQRAPQFSKKISMICYSYSKGDHMTWLGERVRLSTVNNTLKFSLHDVLQICVHGHAF